MKLKSYDVIGNIAILKFPSSVKKAEKVRLAKGLLKERKSVKTVVEKKDKIKGRLRTIKTTHLAGEKNLEALYIENACRFKLNIETCYFSPRLANERKEVYSQVKKGERVLVMFGGVGPYAITLAKNSKASEVYSVELGRECSKYAKENVVLNKLNNVKVIQGDVKRVKLEGRFDRIVMARPNLRDSFLECALKVVKKGSIVNYYGFAKDKEEILDTINKDSLKSKKKIKIFCVKKAGDIAPGKFRWRVDFKIL